jgi:hypothetical protein
MKLHAGRSQAVNAGLAAGVMPLLALPARSTDGELPQDCHTWKVLLQSHTMTCRFCQQHPLVNCSRLLCIAVTNNGVHGDLVAGGSASWLYSTAGVPGSPEIGMPALAACQMHCVLIPICLPDPSSTAATPLYS